MTTSTTRLTPFAQALRCAAIGLAPGLVPMAALALPTGSAVQSGMVSIDTPTAGVMTINQGSANAAVNWAGFDIGQGELVSITQPSTQSVLVNTITSQSVTEIFGSLSANGRVFLINPNGILFGQGAAVDVGGLVASTMGITGQDSISGQYAFAAGMNAGSVSNGGNINSNGGFVVLAAPLVSNSGTIVADGGHIALVGAPGMNLALDTQGLTAIDLTGLASDQRQSGVLNIGDIAATNGQVQLLARVADVGGLAVQQFGIVRATSLDSNGGRIRLVGEGGGVLLGGNVDASGSFNPDRGEFSSAGGQVLVQSSGAIAAFQGTQVLADGTSGGQVRLEGTITQQFNPDTGQTQSVSGLQLDPGSSVSARGNAGGGTVVFSGALSSNDLAAANVNAGFRGTVYLQGASLAIGDYASGNVVCSQQSCIDSNFLQRMVGGNGSHVVALASGDINVDNDTVPLSLFGAGNVSLVRGALAPDSNGLVTGYTRSNTAGNVTSDVLIETGGNQALLLDGGIAGRVSGSILRGGDITVRGDTIALEGARAFGNPQNNPQPGFGDLRLLSDGGGIDIGAQGGVTPDSGLFATTGGSIRVQGNMTVSAPTNQRINLRLLAGGNGGSTSTIGLRNVTTDDIIGDGPVMVGTPNGAVVTGDIKTTGFVFVCNDAATDCLGRNVSAPNASLITGDIEGTSVRLRGTGSITAGDLTSRGLINSDGPSDDGAVRITQGKGNSATSGITAGSVQAFGGLIVKGGGGDIALGSVFTERTSDSEDSAQPGTFGLFVDAGDPFSTQGAANVSMGDVLAHNLLLVRAPGNVTIGGLRASAVHDADTVPVSVILNAGGDLQLGNQVRAAEIIAGGGAAQLFGQGRGVTLLGSTVLLGNQLGAAGLSTANAGDYDFAASQVLADLQLFANGGDIRLAGATQVAVDNAATFQLLDGNNTVTQSTVQGHSTVRLNAGGGSVTSTGPVQVQGIGTASVDISGGMGVNLAAGYDTNNKATALALDVKAQAGTFSAVDDSGSTRTLTGGIARVTSRSFGGGALNVAGGLNVEGPDAFAELSHATANFTAPVVLDPITQQPVSLPAVASIAVRAHTATDANGVIASELVKDGAGNTLLDDRGGTAVLDINSGFDSAPQQGPGLFALSGDILVRGSSAQLNARSGPSSALNLQTKGGVQVHSPEAYRQIGDGTLREGYIALDHSGLSRLLPELGPSSAAVPAKVVAGEASFTFGVGAFGSPGLTALGSLVINNGLQLTAPGLATTHVNASRISIGGATSVTSTANALLNGLQTQATFLDTLSASCQSTATCTGNETPTPGQSVFAVLEQRIGASTEGDATISSAEAKLESQGGISLGDVSLAGGNATLVVDSQGSVTTGNLRLSQSLDSATDLVVAVTATPTQTLAAEEFFAGALQSTRRQQGAQVQAAINAKDQIVRTGAITLSGGSLTSLAVEASSFTSGAIDVVQASTPAATVLSASDPRVSASELALVPGPNGGMVYQAAAVERGIAPTTTLLLNASTQQIAGDLRVQGTGSVQLAGLNAPVSGNIRLTATSANGVDGTLDVRGTTAGIALAPQRPVGVLIDDTFLPNPNGNAGADYQTLAAPVVTNLPYSLTTLASGNSAGDILIALSGALLTGDAVQMKAAGLLQIVGTGSDTSRPTWVHDGPATLIGDRVVLDNIETSGASTGLSALELNGTNTSASTQGVEVRNSRIQGSPLVLKTQGSSILVQRSQLAVNAANGGGITLDAAGGNVSVSASNLLGTVPVRLGRGIRPAASPSGSSFVFAGNQLNFAGSTVNSAQSDVTMTAASNLRLDGSQINAFSLNLRAQDIAAIGQAPSAITTGSLYADAPTQDYRQAVLTLGTETNTGSSGDTALLDQIAQLRPALSPSVAAPNAAFLAPQSIAFGAIQGTARYIEVQSDQVSFGAPVNTGPDLFLHLRPIGNADIAVTNLSYANNARVFVLGSSGYTGAMTVTDPAVPALAALAPRLALADNATGVDYLFTTAVPPPPPPPPPPTMDNPPVQDLVPAQLLLPEYPQTADSSAPPKKPRRRIALTPGELDPGRVLIEDIQHSTVEGQCSVDGGGQ